MIDRTNPKLSITRQCRILSISRSSFYYATKGESEANLALMRRIDELFMKYPFYGSRQMVRHLRREGVEVGRHRVRRLMRLMGLEAIYQAPRTSDPQSRTPDLSLSALGHGDQPGQPGLMLRHHLYPGATWLSVPGGDHGLCHAACACLAAVEHHGYPVLP